MLEQTLPLKNYKETDTSISTKYGLHIRVLREMQLKITVRYHFTPTRKTKIRRTQDTKHWQ